MVCEFFFNFFQLQLPGFNRQFLSLSPYQFNYIVQRKIGEIFGITFFKMESWLDAEPDERFFWEFWTPLDIVLNENKILIGLFK